MLDWVEWEAVEHCSDDVAFSSVQWETCNGLRFGIFNSLSDTIDCQFNVTAQKDLSRQWMLDFWPKGQTYGYIKVRIRFNKMPTKCNGIIQLSKLHVVL